MGNIFASPQLGKLRKLHSCYSDYAYYFILLMAGKNTEQAGVRVKKKKVADDHVERKDT